MLGPVNGLSYRYWDGQRWLKRTVDTFDRTGYSNGLAVDSKGRAHITYSREENGSSALKYFRNR